jgi:hypothetical protein
MPSPTRALAHVPGELRGIGAGEIGKFHELKHVAHAFSVAGGAKRDLAQSERDVGLDRKVRKQASS